MKDLSTLDNFRVYTPDILQQFGSYGDETCGAFVIPSPATGTTLNVLASSDPGSGWDHVSVSVPNRTPNWKEMSLIHRLFFNEDETVWQYHVNAAEHINVHPNCLHLWRKHKFEMPMPPREFV